MELKHNGYEYAAILNSHGREAFKKKEQRITVKIRNVYGEDKIYPVSDQAKLFANIAGTKTLTDYTIARIKQLGYAIRVEQQTL
tara:strand:+ start:231 stop:482 length:252 start_codon:yes stop_codon:yes gene_type:complete